LGQQNGYRALRVSDGLAVAALSEVGQIADMPPAGGSMDASVDVMGVPSAMDTSMGAPVDAPMQAVDIPMTPLEAQDVDVPLPEPDMPMMPMENAPIGDADNIPMAAMPMDIDIG